ncbi:uncharacterized protein [Ambystoma mexicanum]
MGAKYAPSLANLFMAYFEEKYIFQNNPFKHNIIRWKRYIDDVLAIWEGSKEDFAAFMLYLNDNTFDIKFTGHMDAAEITFLDLKINIVSNNIETCTFRKETAVNSILHATSSHRQSVIQNIPRGEMLRAKRNCSQDEMFQIECKSIGHRFRERGYPIQLIRKTTDAVKKIPRPQLLINKTKVSSEQYPKHVNFITKYSSDHKFIQYILKKHWHILHLDSDLISYITDRPSIIFTKAKTLRKILSPSFLKPDPIGQANWLTTSTKPAGFYKCGTCNFCHHALAPTKIFSCHNGLQTKIFDFINCRTKFVIYGILCVCQKMYIGSTIREVRFRIREHLNNLSSQDIRLPLASHWQKHHQLDNIKDIKFIGLKHIQQHPRGGNRELTLRQQEARMICKLRCLSLGLNQDHELNVFL